MGATGAGKSTFIDALFNYVTGVSMTDEFRYSIINKNREEKEREYRQVFFFYIYLEFISNAHVTIKKGYEAFVTISVGIEDSITSNNWEINLI